MSFNSLLKLLFLGFFWPKTFKTVMILLQILMKTLTKNWNWARFEKPFQCEKCLTRFKRKQDFVKHQRRHHHWALSHSLSFYICTKFKKRRFSQSKTQSHKTYITRASQNHISLYNYHPHLSTKATLQHTEFTCNIQ